MLVAQLPLGSSRAAELEARTSEGEDEETIVEPVTGLSISQLTISRRPIAEPWARKECAKREIGQFPSPKSRAHSPPRRGDGRRKKCRVRREVPRNTALAAGLAASLPPPVLRSPRVRLRRDRAIGEPFMHSRLNHLLKES